MRLDPVPAPPSLRSRLFEWVAARMIGRSTTPTEVIYRRVPRMWDVSRAFLRLTADATLPPDLVFLLEARVANLRRCAFCEDIARAQAMRRRIGMDRFDALSSWTESDLFDARERAALRLVDEASQLRGLTDATWEEAARHFDSRQLVEILSLVAIESFYNALNLSLDIPSDGLETLARTRKGVESETGSTRNGQSDRSEPVSARS